MASLSGTEQEALCKAVVELVQENSEGGKIARAGHFWQVITNDLAGKGYDRTERKWQNEYKKLRTANIAANGKDADEMQHLSKMKEVVEEHLKKTGFDNIMAYKARQAQEAEHTSPHASSSAPTSPGASTGSSLPIRPRPQPQEEEKPVSGEGIAFRGKPQQ